MIWFVFRKVFENKYYEMHELCACIWSIMCCKFLIFQNVMMDTFIAFVFSTCKTSEVYLYQLVIRMPVWFRICLEPFHTIRGGVGRSHNCQLSLLNCRWKIHHKWCLVLFFFSIGKLWMTVIQTSYFLCWKGVERQYYGIL